MIKKFGSFKNVHMSTPKARNTSVKGLKWKGMRCSPDSVVKSRRVVYNPPAPAVFPLQWLQLFLLRWLPWLRLSLLRLQLFLLRWLLWLQLSFLRWLPWLWLSFLRYPGQTTKAQGQNIMNKSKIEGTCTLPRVSQFSYLSVVLDFEGFIPWEKRKGNIVPSPHCVMSWTNFCVAVKE